MKRLILTASLLLIGIVMFAQIPFELGQEKSDILNNIIKRGNVPKESATQENNVVITEDITDEILCAYYLDKNKIFCYFQRVFYPVRMKDCKYNELQGLLKHNDSTWVDPVYEVYYELNFKQGNDYFAISCYRVYE